MLWSCLWCDYILQLGNAIHTGMYGRVYLFFQIYYKSTIFTSFLFLSFFLQFLQCLLSLLFKFMTSSLVIIKKIIFQKPCKQYPTTVSLQMQMCWLQENYTKNTCWKLRVQKNSAVLSLTLGFCSTFWNMDFKHYFYYFSQCLCFQ